MDNNHTNSKRSKSHATYRNEIHGGNESSPVAEDKVFGVINMVSVRKIDPQLNKETCTSGESPPGSHNFNQKNVDEIALSNSNYGCKLTNSNKQDLENNNPKGNLNDIVMEGKSYSSKFSDNHTKNKKQVHKRGSNKKPSTPGTADANVLDGEVLTASLYSEKPVIITAANTNKQIKLEPRKGIKLKQVDKPRIHRNLLLKREGTNKTDGDERQSTKEKNTKPIAPSIEIPSTTDIGKSLEDRLKSFARMDVEFYDIISKMDEANDKRNFMPDDNKSQEGIDKQFAITENILDDHLKANVLDDHSVIYGKANQELTVNIHSENDNIEQSTASLTPVPTSPFLDGSQVESNEINTINDVFSDNHVEADGLMISNYEEHDIRSSIPATPKTPVVVKETITETVGNTQDLGHDKIDVGTNMYNKVLDESMIVSGKKFKENYDHLKGPEEDFKFDEKEDVHYETRESISSLLREIPDVEALDMEEALKIMKLQTVVSNEEIIHIMGDKMPLTKREISNLTERDKNLVVTAAPRMHTVHQFCTSYIQGELDMPSKTLSRYSHAPSKYTVLKPRVMKVLGDSKFDVVDAEVEDDDDSSALLLNLSILEDKTNELQQPVDEEEKRLSEIAVKVMDDIEAGKHISNNRLVKLKNFIEEMSDPSDCLETGVTGEKVETRHDESRYFNTPCPPKFNITPQVVTNTLAPDYISVLEMENDISEECVLEEIDAGIEETEIYEVMSADEKIYKERIVNRRHNSAMEMYEVDVSSSNISDEETIQPKQDDRFMSVLDLRRKYNRERPGSAFSISYDDGGKPIYERSHSQPNMSLIKPVENPLLTDYNSIMDETKAQYEQLKTIKADPLFLDEKRKTVDGENRGTVSRREKTLFDNIEVLSRSKSVGRMNSDISHHRVLQRSSSESNLPSLNKEVMAKHELMSVDLNDWLKEEFWYKWFDELFPPNDSEEIFSESAESKAESSVSDGITQQIEVLPKRDSHIYNITFDEIKSLSKRIDRMGSSSGLLGFHLCRRGACYRKIGELKKALDDLNQALELEPKLTDAYWHRHLVHIIQNNTRKALEDLNRITLYNPYHTGAHRSRAEIYRKKGESNLAISGYNQAIASDPKNAELYYARAELLEQRGELLLAVDDYKSADMYEPENTWAIKKIGMYHFEHELWMIAVNDFTDLLKKQSTNEVNAEAYMFRGRSWANLGKFTEAISDLSASITLQPDNFLPFYYRGCYLRKCMPKQALQDFSVSLLLDSTVNNVNSFLHRGILYMELKRYDQATCDFQQAVRLNPHLAPAHVNLGVIEMKHNRNIHLAVKRFNVALRMDPTYIRAILCRAEAAERVNNINGAILDYTRAIHMKPDSIDLRMSRGRLLLKKDQLDLASFHIKQCAVMNDGKNASPTQKAAVQTFLKNYDSAINVLELAVKSQPIVHLFGLLGRTRMKAKQFKDAILEFKRALKLLKPWDSRANWPKESAEIFFLIGVCYMELNEYKSALDSFNISLKTNPTFAEGYFKRGLVKMKLGVSKGVHDFNKALSFRPEFYQAYLGRAAFYGMNKRYAKAIMNCNEAIKIEKESIRAFLYRGAVKYNIKAYSLAIKDLSQAIQMDCTCSLAYFNRAVCFHEKKYYFHALKDYSIVLMSDSNLEMKALLNRGLLYFQIGDMENAVHDFVSALQADPDNPKLHHSLGLCYHKLGKLKKSIESYTNALRVDPFFSDALLGRGNVLMDYNQKLGTLLGKRDYLRALHMNPLCMEARVNLAYSLQTQGYFKKAWNLFTRTIEIDPEYKAALEGRALVNLQMSNAFASFVDMNNAIMISKTAESLTLRGVVNQFLDDRVSAMNDYRAAKTLEPTYSLAYYNAANLYFLHRQLSQAITFYSKAIDWNPHDGAAILNRAVAKCICKDYQGAIDDFAMVEKLYPHWSHIYFNRGYLHFLTEKFELAEEDYTRALILLPNDALLYKKRADARGKCGKKELALKDFRRSIHLQMSQKSK